MTSPTPPLPNQPNPNSNLFGQGGSVGIAGKATNSLRTMNGGAAQLVSQLRTAVTLMQQMQSMSAQIAKNLSGVNVSGGGGGGGGGRPAGAATGAGGVGSSGNNLLRRATFAFVGSQLTKGMGKVGSDLLAMSDRATFVRQWNPYTFSGQGQALGSIRPDVAAGRNALDATSNYSLFGYGLGGSNFTRFSNDAAFAARAANMSYERAVDAVGGITNVQTSWALRKNLGIWARDPRTMKMADPSDIAHQILNFGDSRFKNGTPQERVQGIEWSLRSGGGLDTTLSRAGITGDTRNAVVASFLAEARTGKNVSSMSAAEKQKLLNSPDYRNFRSSQAERSSAAADAESRMVDSADTAYQKTADAETKMIGLLTKIDDKLGGILSKIGGGALGAGGALGLGGGALGGAVGSLLGGFLGKRALGGAVGGLGRLLGRGAGAGTGALGRLLGGAGGLSSAGGAASKLGTASRALGKLGVAGMAVSDLINAPSDWNNGWAMGEGTYDPGKDNQSWLDKLGTYTNPVTAVGGIVGLGDAIGGHISNVRGGSERYVGPGSGVVDTVSGWLSGLANVGSRGATQQTEGGAGAVTSASSTAGRLITEAERWIGTPYSWGGGGISGPTLGSGRGAHTKGFDCSGFTQYVYGRFGVRLPRTSQAQASSGKEVPKSEATAGDLLIFTFSEPNGHCGVYMGGSKMIHAPHTGSVVQVSNVPWANVTHIRRVLSGSARPGNTDVGTSGTGSAIGAGSDSGGIYFNGHAITYFSSPSDSAAANATAAGGGPASGDSGRGGGRTAPPGQVKRWIDQALSILGKSPKRFEWGLYNMVMHESGGNPRAENRTDSNWRAGHPSKGIMQTIDSTFNQWSIPGHKNIWAPVDNIIAGFRYAEGRYGDEMIAAGGRHGKNGGYLGYSEGAWRINKDQDARIHEGEMILPKAMAESMRTAIREGFTGGGNGHTCEPIAVSMNVTINGASDGQAMQLVRTFERTVTRASAMKTIRKR